MTHNLTKTSTTPHSPAVIGGGSLVILLCAPSHDTLTEYTSELLDNFPGLGAPAVLHKFVSPLRYDQLLSSLSINPGTTDVALIFCGHGESPELQGPGAHPGAAGYGDARSAFYDESFLDAGLVPKFLLAFCCSAAAGLGDAYERKTSGGVFVGFDTEIGFVTRGGDYADWFRKILHGAASAMLNNAGAGDPEEAVRQMYKSALSYFNSPAGKKRCKWWLTMSMYLRGQLESLKFIPT